MRPNVPDIRFNDKQDAEIAAYRPVAGQAVFGLLFALVAPLALLDPICWLLPVLGVLFSAWALRRIKNHDGALTGRKLAVAALTVSLLVAAAAPTDWLVYRWKIRGEARQFSALWLRCIAQEQPHYAHQLTVAPSLRQPRDNNLWNHYRSDPRTRMQLEGYVNSPLIRTMLALGPKSQVRFYQTVRQGRSNERDEVEQWYAVTYEEDGEKKSFFIALDMERWPLPNGTASWRVAQTRIAHPPES